MLTKLLTLLQKQFIDIVKPRKQRQDLENIVSDHHILYSDRLITSIDEIKQFKKIINSTGDKNLLLYFNTFLENPDSNNYTKLCNKFKHNKLYFSCNLENSGKYILGLGKIDLHEKRSKSSGIATYKSEFYSVEPIIDRNKNWNMFTKNYDIVLNKNYYDLMAEAAWKAKEKGELDELTLKKFTSKKKNIKKNKFLKQFSLKLMNDSYQELVRNHLTKNSELVDLLRKRLYAYYEFIKTGNRVPGYSQEDFPKRNDEFMLCAKQIGSPAIVNGLNGYFVDGKNPRILQDTLNEYFMKFGQFIQLASSFRLNDMGMAFVKGEVRSNSLFRLFKQRDNKINLSDGTSLSYSGYFCGSPIVTNYEQYYTHNKMYRNIGNATSYPRNIIFINEEQCIQIAKKSIDFYLNIKQGNSCFEMLAVGDKSVYLALDGMLADFNVRYLKSNKVFAYIKKAIIYSVLIHEETHLVPKNRNFEDNWKKERNCFLNQLRFSNPQLSLGSYVIGCAFMDEKKIDPIYIKAGQSILSEYVSYIKCSKSKNKDSYKDINIEGITLEEQIHDFYRLKPNEIKHIASQLSERGL